MVDVAKIRRNLLLGLFLLASASLITHFSWHPPLRAPEGRALANTMASVLTLLDAVWVTWLFSRKKTAAWGYLINGLLVIYGTVFMTHFGWSAVGGQASPFRYLLHSMTPEIMILWADFFAGSVLYRLWFIEPAAKG